MWSFVLYLFHLNRESCYWGIVLIKLLYRMKKEESLRSVSYIKLFSPIFDVGIFDKQLEFFDSYWLTVSFYTETPLG